jgi:hypothetical protein
MVLKWRLWWSSVGKRRRGIDRREGEKISREIVREGSSCFMLCKRIGYVRYQAFENMSCREVFVSVECMLSNVLLTT